MIQASSMTLAIELLCIGIVALLYSIRLLTDVFVQGVNTRVQRSLAPLVRHPLLAFGLGVGATALLQSSNAMASLLVNLVNAEVLPLATAIVFLLGANVGSTLVVPLLAWHLPAHALLFLGLGTLAALWTRNTSLYRIGQTCFAFGLLLLGLDCITQGSQPLLANPLITHLLQTQQGAPAMLLLLGALLAVMASSSAAALSVILSLATTGTLSLPVALALMAGANVGTTVGALLSAFHNGTIAGRRLALLHTGTKLCGAIAMLLFLSPLATFLTFLWPNPETQVALMHVVFNGALALVFVSVAPWLARLMTWLLPDPPAHQDHERSLDPHALATPSLALGQATRAMLGMAEAVETMLEHSQQVFAVQVDAFPGTTQKQEKQLDELYRAVKRYLARLDGTRLSPWETSRQITLFSLVADLEAIGDVVAGRFVHVMRRKQQEGFLFSAEGREELLTSYREVLEAFHYVQAALTAWDSDLANAFLLTLDQHVRTTYHLRLRHLRRLQTGNPCSLASSSLHLDLLDAFQEILGHLTSMAHALQDHRAIIAGKSLAKTSLSPEEERETGVFNHLHI